MGNACCSEDRECVSAAMKSELGTLMSAAKDVEAAIPRLRGEVNRLGEELADVIREEEALAAGITDGNRQVKSLEVMDLCDAGRMVAVRKSLKTAIAEIRQGKDDMERMLTADDTPLHRLEDDQLRRSMSFLHEKDSETTSVHIQRVLSDLQSSKLALCDQKAVFSLYEAAAESLDLRLRADSQAVLALLEDISDFRKNRGGLLQTAIMKDTEIAKVSHTAKPSYLYERVLELYKDAVELKKITQVKGQQVAFLVAESGGRKQEIADLEREIDSVVTELQQSSTQVDAESPLRRGSSISPAKAKPQAEAVDLDSIKNSLRREEKQLQAASESLFEMQQALKESEEGVVATKARVLLLVSALRNTRVAVQAVARWRINARRASSPVTKKKPIEVHRLEECHSGAASPTNLHDQSQRTSLPRLSLPPRFAKRPASLVLPI